MFFTALLISSVENYAIQGKDTRIFHVVRAIDGDTFRLSNGQILKLAGINTPELHNMPILTEEAKRFKKDIWAYRNVGGDAHKAVMRFLGMARNEIEVESGMNAFDENGNLLGYVYLSVDKLDAGETPDSTVFFQNGDHYEIFLNAYLVKMGFAEAVGSGDSNYDAPLLKLQTEAKESKRGLWV